MWNAITYLMALKDLSIAVASFLFLEYHIL